MNQISTAPAADWRQLALLPLRDAARIAGISTASLYRYEADGLVQFKRLAGRTLIPSGDLAKLVDGAEAWKPSGRCDAATAARSSRASGGAEA